MTTSPLMSKLVPARIPSVNVRSPVTTVVPKLEVRPVALLKVKLWNVSDEITGAPLLTLAKTAVPPLASKTPPVWLHPCSKVMVPDGAVKLPPVIDTKLLIERLPPVEPTSEPLRMVNVSPIEEVLPASNVIVVAALFRSSAIIWAPEGILKL
jgi:hypothetical protein